jgi:ankyrin repeat protein
MMGAILVVIGVVALAGCFYLAFSVSRALRPYWMDRSLLDTLKQQDRDDPGPVKQRLDAGANVNARDDLGDTPLILVAQYDHTATARLLLERGADVNARDKQGMTALMEAAKGGHAAAVELLLGHGAQSEGKTSYGETALSLARENGHTDCERLLKQHGARE